MNIRSFTNVILWVFLVSSVFSIATYEHAESASGSVVYVVGFGSNGVVLELFDGTSNASIGTVQLGGATINPLDVEITRDGRIAYVAIHSQSRIVAVDTESLQIIRSYSIYHPWDISLSPDERYLFVCNHGRNLPYIDLSTGEILIWSRIAGPYGTWAMDFNSDGSLAYVTGSGTFRSDYWGGQAVFVVDPSDGTVLNEIRIDNRDGYAKTTTITVSPDDTFLYVTTRSGVAHIDTGTETLVGTIEGTEIPFAYGGDLVFDADGRYAFALLETGWMSGGWTWKIDTTVHSAVQSLPVHYTYSPRALDVAHDSSSLYVVGSTFHTPGMGMLSTVTGNVIQNIPLPNMAPPGYGAIEVTVYPRAENQPPSADAGGPYSGDESTDFPLNNAIASDPDGDNLTYNWTVNSPLCSFSDDSVLNPTIICDDNGSYIVTLTVDDGTADPITSDATVTVNNVAPDVQADVDAVTVDEGDTANNSGNFSDPGDDTVTISASVGTVTQDTGNFGNWSWSFDSTDGPDESQVITVTATDSDGDASSTTFDLTVNNVAPTVDAGANQIVFENNTIELDPATFSDPGDDTHTAEIDWGDTTVESGTVDQNADNVFGYHVYGTPGIYTVTVTVEDSDGDSSSDSLTVTVLQGLFEACISANKQGDDLKLEEGASADCDVRGEGKVTLKKEASVGGDVTSGDDVKLEEDSSVAGDVTAAGKVELKSGATVGGVISDYALVPEVTQVSVSVSASGDDETIKKNVTVSLSPGSYGKLKVEEGGTLELSAGDYTFESMDVHKNATIAIALGNGDVVIDVEKKVDLKEGVEMTVSDGSASDILFRVSGSELKLGKAGTFLGTFVAPEAHIDMHEDAELTGALHGRKVQLKKDAAVIAAPAVDLLIDKFVP